MKTFESKSKVENKKQTEKFKCILESEMKGILEFAKIRHNQYFYKPNHLN